MITGPDEYEEELPDKPQDGSGDDPDEGDAFRDDEDDRPQHPDLDDMGNAFSDADPGL